MNDDNETYLLHQTPYELAKELIKFCRIELGQRVVEPFRGEGAFYNNFPDIAIKDYSEIRQGKDYKDLATNFDWVITNPPFQIEDEKKKLVNAFWPLLDYFTQHARAGVAFLGNDRCFSTLTPQRMAVLASRGFHLSKVVLCGVKKWRGRYYFLIFEKKPNSFFEVLPKNY